MKDREFIKNKILVEKYIKNVSDDCLKIIGRIDHTYKVDNYILSNDKYILLHKYMLLEYDNFKIFEDCDTYISKLWQTSQYNNYSLSNIELNQSKLKWIISLHKKFPEVLPKILFEDENILLFEKHLDTNQSNNMKKNLQFIVRTFNNLIDSDLFITFNINKFICDGLKYNDVLNIGINYFKTLYITNDYDTMYLLDNKTFGYNDSQLIKKIFIKHNTAQIIPLIDNKSNTIDNILKDII